MRQGRHQSANVNWAVKTQAQYLADSDARAQLAVLMDIREELRALNATFDCQRFQEIPSTLTKLRIGIDQVNRRERRKAKEKR